MAKPTITTRATKGSALTWTEGDANITNLQNATIAIKADTGGTDVVSDLNGTVTLVAGTNVTISGDNTAKTVTINAAGGSGITDVVQDLTPQLGGDLDVNGHTIVSSSNGNINIIPNGSGNINITPATGKIVLGATDWPAGPGSTGQVLTTSGGTGVLSWQTPSGASTANFTFSTNTITSTGNINLVPDSAANVVIDGLNWPATDGTNGQVLKTNGAGDLSFTTITPGISSVSQDTGPTLGGNLNTSGYNLYTTNNANITLAPNGAGKVQLSGLNYPTADGTANQVIKTDGAGNLSFTTISSGASNLDGLTDVVITSAATGDVLSFNGTNWVDVASTGLAAGQVALTSDNSTNATNYPLFSSTSTGNVSPRTDTGFTYNPSTGILTATTFVGALTGNATTASSATYASAVTLTADDSTNATNYPLFVNAATGNLSPRTDTGFTYNPSTGKLTVFGFTTVGDYKKTGGSSGWSWTTAGAAFGVAAASYTDSAAAGTVAASYINSFNAPTFASTNAITVTEATNMYLADPVAGTNTTLTNKTALLSDGNIKLKAQKELHFADSDSTHYVGFKAPATVSTNKVWTLPATDGTSGQVLSTNGSATLSWATAGGGGNNIILIHSGLEYITIGTGGTNENWTLATAGGVSGVSVSTNTFTLPAGNYFFELPYTFSDGTTGYDFRLRNITDSVDVGVITSNTISLSGVSKKTYWSYQTHFTIAASKTFNIRTNSGSFQANMGYTSNGKYTVKITKY